MPGSWIWLVGRGGSDGLCDPLTTLLLSFTTWLTRVAEEHVRRNQLVRLQLGDVERVVGIYRDPLSVGVHNPVIECKKWAPLRRSEWHPLVPWRYVFRTVYVWYKPYWDTKCSEKRSAKRSESVCQFHRLLCKWFDTIKCSETVLFWT